MTKQGAMKTFKLCALLPLVLSGCYFESRKETQKADKITINAQVAVPTSDGVKVAPITGTIRRNGTESEERHTAPDIEALTQAITSALSKGASTSSAMPISHVLPWSDILSSALAALTAATTGYLAIKKREQIKSAKGQSSH